MMSILFVVALLGVAYGVELTNFVSIPMHCRLGPGPAAVPFFLDPDGATDGLVPVDAINFHNRYEHCATEFFNDEIPVDVFLSPKALAADGEQCTDVQNCIPFSDTTWRKELTALQGYVDVVSSKYRFDEVAADAYSISGQRQLVLEMDKPPEGYTAGQVITNDFTQTIVFNKEGRVVKSTTNTQGLATDLEKWGLKHLGQYGFAKVNPELKTINRGPSGGYNIVFGEESVFYICLVAALLILSFTVCTVSAQKYKYDNQVVSYSKVRRISASDAN